MCRKGLLFIYSVVIFFIGVLGVRAEDSSKIKDFSLSINSNKEILIKIDCEECDENAKFNIYRSLDGINWLKIDVALEKTYIDLDTKPNFKYYYKISEITDEVLEIEEDFLEIKSTSYGFSLPVIKVTSKSYNQLLISWNLVKGAEKYEIYRSTSKTGSYTKIATTTSLNYTDGSRAFNTTYYYKVRALNTVNGVIKYSGYSATIDNKTLPATPVLNLISKTYNSIGISWQKVSGVTGYEIQKYDSINKIWKTLKTQTGTSYTDINLIAGKTYEYRVRAYKTVGSKKIYGSYSNIGKIISIPSTPSVTAFSVRSNQIDLNWPKVDGATGYRIQKYFNDTMVLEEFTPSIKYVDNLVSFNNEYKYVITAYRTVSNVKIYSNPKTITKKATPTGGVVNKYYTTPNKITLEYGMYSSEDIDGFVINRYTTTTDKETILNITYEDAMTNNFKLEDINLGSNKNYKYQIYTYRYLENNSDKIYSDVKEYSIKTLPMAPIITIQNSSYTSLKISYAKVEGATGYEIYRATSKTGKYTKISTTTALSYNDTGKTFNKTYYYKVRAYVTINGIKVYGAYSEIKSLKVLTSAPVVKSSYTYNTITLSWAKVSGATGYEIQRYDSTSKTWKSLKVQTGLSYTDLKLTTGKTYEYRVRSYKTVSGKKIYGPYSGTLKVTPVPVATSNFNVYSSSSTLMVLLWKQVSGASGYDLKIYYNDQLIKEDTFSSTEIMTHHRDTVLNETYKYEIIPFRMVSGIKIYGDSKVVFKRATPSTIIINDKLTTTTGIYMEYTTDIIGHETVDGFIITRATSKDGEYKTVMDVSLSEAIANEYQFYDGNLKVNTTYYYKVYSYIRLNGEKILSVANSYSYKTVPEKPMFESTQLIQYTESSIYLILPGLNIYEVDGYEIYRATSKTGTYTKIKTITGNTAEDTVLYLNSNLKYGNTYYYKVRSYKTINGVKYYSSYSDILGKKMQMNSIDKYPIYLYTLSGSEVKINSVSFKYLKTIGSNTQYEVTVKTNLFVTSSQKISFTLFFYNIFNEYEDYKTYTFSTTPSTKSKTLTFTITVPSTAVYYEFY